MKLKLHHVNLVSTDVSAMDTFYREVLDMEPEPTMARQRIKDQGYPGDVSFVTDGTTQFHLAEKDIDTGFFSAAVYTADLNSDSKPDVVLFNPGSQKFSVLLNNCR